MSVSRWLGCLLVLLIAAAASAQSPPSLNLGRYHALVIGNQQYRHLPSLKTPALDAAAVADLLRKDYGFSVRLLVNSTRVEMVDALADLRGKLGADDNLLIYYAGHGYLDREADRGYWMAVDAEQNSPANWLSNADITDALRAMKAKHVLIVADSCYSGTLTRDLAIRAPEASDVARLAQKRARNVLTSGGLEPVSDVGGSGHSVFAHAFMESLRSNSGVTDMTTLFTGLRRQVLLKAEQTPQYGDVRLAGHDGGDFIFARAGAKVAALRPPAPAERPRLQEREEIGHQDVTYRKLASEAFVGDYKNVTVHFKAMFVGEWTSTQAYRQGGVRTADRVFVNHRDVSYVAQETGLGSSDMAFPEFALSVPKGQSDIVYELKRGDIIEVWGRAEEARLPGKRGLHILAERIVNQRR